MRGSTVMKAALGGVLGVLALAPLMTMAQLRGLGPEFVITRINKNLVPTPQYTLAGAGQQYPVNTHDMWLEEEVEFSAAPAWTDDLTFKYYILFNGKLLTGEVTHKNVPAGRENRSVMYVSPRALARFA